jgi:hypothetical protein
VPDRRGSRFVLEVLFLLGLTVGLTLAKLSPLEIGGVMLVGWVIVAGLEWAAWRGEPHYGSGLPPRYYVPRVNLPPAQPLEQVATGYPDATRDEAPTWIASAALRDELLGEWPMAAPMTEQVEVVETVVESVSAPEAAPVVLPAVDPWLVQELPVAPLGELEPEPELVAPEPEAVAVEPELEAEPVPAEPAPAPEPEAELAPALDVALAHSAQGVAALGVAAQSTARYHLDPLADPPPRRRFGRSGGEAPAAVDVPARPEGVRSLPGRPARQD